MSLGSQTTPALSQQVDGAMVEDMRDGGMGSLRFSSKVARSLGTAVAEADYVDFDGVPISIVINVDQQGATPDAIYAPNGLQMLYDGILTMNSLTPHLELFEAKAASYRSRWPWLQSIGLRANMTGGQ